jgi:two-component system sensor histidine kinase TtrS
MSKVLTPILWKKSVDVLCYICLIVYFSSSLNLPAYAQSSDVDKTARIGVLAFRGADPAQSQWQPLAEYLTVSVAGWQFEIVPLTLVSAPEEIKANGLEFLITNPGHYVTLAEQFGLSALATRERRAQVSGSGLLRYGTAIFALKDSGIQNLGDLRGKQVAAVSLDAFGGFQLAWQEFASLGIDPFTDIKTLRFMGFPQDEIVSAVARGDVQAGVIRSGLLESLNAEGRINLSDFVVLQSNSQLGYPHMVSGRLYPEWPFTALPGIDKTLREAVTVALLETQKPRASNDYLLKDIWSAPLSYEDVRVLTRAYRNRDKATPLWESLARNPLVYIFLIAALAAALMLVWKTQLRVLKGDQVEVGDPEEDQKEDPEIADIKRRFESLTKRELEILSMICFGHPSKEIAETLGISPKTVEYHRANLLQKTDAGTTAHLVQLATRFGYDLGITLGDLSK